MMLVFPFYQFFFLIFFNCFYLLRLLFSLHSNSQFSLSHLQFCILNFQLLVPCWYDGWALMPSFIILPGGCVFATAFHTSPIAAARASVSFRTVLALVPVLIRRTPRPEVEER